MSFLDKLKAIEGDIKEVEPVIKDIKKKIKKLTPPPPAPMLKSDREGHVDPLASIDYIGLAKSIDFQRLVIKIAKMILPAQFSKVSVRTTREKMTTEFNSTVSKIKKEMTFVDEMQTNALFLKRKAMAGNQYKENSL